MTRAVYSFRMRFCALLLGLMLTFVQAQTTTRDFSDLLETVRAKYNLPSLSGVAVLRDSLYGAGTVGKTRVDGDVRVTPQSAYQLGSVSKAMNATMIARLVERGLLRWDSTLAEVLPDVRMRDEYKAVTLELLLTHRSGIVGNAEISPAATREPARKQYLEAALAQPRGAKTYLYSNVGYVTAAMMAERVTGKPWDALMREEILEPLGMTGCAVGFGVEGDPLPHRFQAGQAKALPMNSGNPRVLDGADQMRCPLTSFARYVSAHLLGERGESPLLKPETWKRLHTDPFGNQYAFGWLVGTRTWARGGILTHSGSNTNNYAVVWIAPERGVAVVVATNIGVDETNSLDKVTRIADEAVAALLTELLKVAP